MSHSNLVCHLITRRDDHAVPIREVLLGVDLPESPLTLDVLAHRPALAIPVLDDEGAAGAEQLPSALDDGDRYREAVDAAAVQGRGRIVVAHFGLEGFAYEGDVGRVGDDDVDRAVELREEGGVVHIPLPH